MPIKLTLAEVIDVMVRRENITLSQAAQEMGYKPNTFYAKRTYRRWNIQDLKNLKKRFDLNVDEILDQI